MSSEFRRYRSAEQLTPAVDSGDVVEYVLKNEPPHVIKDSEEPLFNRLNFYDEPMNIQEIKLLLSDMLGGEVYYDSEFYPDTCILRDVQVTEKPYLHAKARDLDGEKIPLSEIEKFESGQVKLSLELGIVAVASEVIFETDEEGRKVEDSRKRVGLIIYQALNQEPNKDGVPERKVRTDARVYDDPEGEEYSNAVRLLLEE